MKKKPSIVLVTCDVYNDSKDVLFIMKREDSRFNNGNYHFNEEGELKGHVFTTASGRTFNVFSDWSVKEFKKKISTPVIRRSIKRARAIVKTYMDLDPDLEAAVKDALTDIRHFCHHKGLDWERMLWSTNEHFSVEVAGKQD